MYGIGGVSPGDWRRRQDFYSCPRPPRSNDEDEPSEEERTWSPATDTRVANPIPQLTASVGEAVSRLQVAIQQADDVCQKLIEFTDHLQGAGKGKVAASTIHRLYDEAREVIEAIHHMERCFYACRYAIRPELTITFDVHPVPVEQLASVALTWEASESPRSDWLQTMRKSVGASHMAVLGYQACARHWLGQLAEWTRTVWARQEKAYGFECDHSNPSKEAYRMSHSAHALSQQLSKEKEHIWNELLPSQVACLLQNPDL